MSNKGKQAATRAKYVIKQYKEVKEEGRRTILVKHAPIPTKIKQTDMKNGLDGRKEEEIK